MTPIRVVITGGGTGGHVYPALAVAEALKTDPDVESVLYIGHPEKAEARMVPPFGIPFQGVRFAGMPRGLNLGIFPWLGQLIRAFLVSRQLLKEFNPHVAFGTGGYVSAPVLLAARSLGIPYVIHEPDAHPGLVNRLMARWSHDTTCAFEGARSRLKTRCLYVTGNPLRNTIGTLDKPAALQRLNWGFSLDKPVLLVTGGSQGAQRLNDATLGALSTLIDTLGFQVIHQTGDKLFDKAQAACPESYQNHPAYKMLPFITDMAAVLAITDIAVCRAGSMTLSEMYRAGIPTILVPYPHAAADHQRKNAQASEAAGASVMIEDPDLSGPKLIATLESLWHTPTTRDTMKAAAQDLAHPEATQTVTQIVKAAAHAMGS